MDSWTLPNGTLEFDNDSHTYLYEGIIVPSITQVMRLKFRGMYASVKPEILKASADHGTAVHSAIENWCKSELPSDLAELRHFQVLKKRYGFEVLKNEIPCVIKEPSVAGRIDLVLRDKEGRLALADIKTTASFEKEYVAYQLNLYKKGYEDTYGEEIQALYIVHVRSYGGKNFRHFKEIPISDIPYEWLKENYERWNDDGAQDN